MTTARLAALTIRLLASGWISWPTTVSAECRAAAGSSDREGERQSNRAFEMSCVDAGEGRGSPPLASSWLAVAPCPTGRVRCCHLLPIANRAPKSHLARGQLRAPPRTALPHGCPPQPQSGQSAQTRRRLRWDDMHQVASRCRRKPSEGQVCLLLIRRAARASVLPMQQTALMHVTGSTKADTPGVGASGRPAEVAAFCAAWCRRAWSRHTCPR